MERRAIDIRGIVQGVGFRPFVHNLASRLKLGGFVRNQLGGVWIEIEGDQLSVGQFVRELSDRPPPLAQIEIVSWEQRAPVGDRGFRIEASTHGAADAVFVTPDAATCAECLHELFDPMDRRYRYPLINCTHCGPRLTIIERAPYDRPNTTMARFRMCNACRAEYSNPTDRRFHAQPIACPDCGPPLRALDRTGNKISNADPVRWFTEELLAGKIGALKGLGGYHLVCDATNATAVAELRRRKLRDQKPFAVMVHSVDQAAALCDVAEGEHRLLQSAQRPIVLLRRRNDGPVAPDVAPANPLLGVMLPYTPIHHLLFHDEPRSIFVMTSGNRSNEPIAYADEDAVNRLGAIADVFLAHDRPIHVRCDDSVSRVVNGCELPIRRSRGVAPQPVQMPMECRRSVLALGGQLKVTFALGHRHQAYLSHHIGDLDDYAAYQAYVQDIRLYEQLFEIHPECLVHDLHPDYASTRFAVERARREGQRLIAVQHHHAHLASCMAEHGIAGPVIGVTFDGTGYGTDGAVWGGEFLVGDYVRFERAAHLRYVPMPGSAQAIREPWRMALAHLEDAELNSSLLESRIPRQSLRAIATMIDRRINSPETSSMGRLFDAVASLAGVRDTVSYEGQAAMELEWLADRGLTQSYPFDLQVESAGDPSERRADGAVIIDTRPLIRGVAGDVACGASGADVARRFHATVVEMIAVVCRRICGRTALRSVVLSGGVFCNAILTNETVARLTADGFTVYPHRLVPPNDGGLSLGQLAVAAATMAATE